MAIGGGLGGETVGGGDPVGAAELILDYLHPRGQGLQQALHPAGMRAGIGAGQQQGGAFRQAALRHGAPRGL